MGFRCRPPPLAIVVGPACQESLLVALVTILHAVDAPRIVRIPALPRVCPLSHGLRNSLADITSCAAALVALVATIRIPHLRVFTAKPSGTRGHVWRTVVLCQPNERSLAVEVCRRP